MGGIAVIYVDGRTAPADFDRRSFLANIAVRHSSFRRCSPGFGLSTQPLRPAWTVPSPARRERPRCQPTTPLRLAQSGDVEIYIDEYGRRVIVDAFTGEVLGIQRPRQNRDYRRQRRLRELNRDQGGFLLDDPDADIPYRPRPYYQGRPVEEYPEAPERGFPESAGGSIPGRAGRLSGGAAAAGRDARADRAPAARRGSRARARR